jgi:hypothetical protein
MRVLSILSGAVLFALASSASAISVPLVDDPGGAELFGTRINLVPEPPPGMALQFDGIDDFATVPHRGAIRFDESDLDVNLDLALEEGDLPIIMEQNARSAPCR